MNKNVVTNGVAALATFAGWYLQQPLLFSVGLFALSGALTNWLAVHMLFEKVPLLYGSGVIPQRFEQFKSGIYQLVMTQFFSSDNIDRFLADEQKSTDPVFDFEPVIAQTDLSPAFDSLLKVVEQSSFGGMLGMFGGSAALQPLKEPFIAKLKLSLTDISQSEQFRQLVLAQLDQPEQLEGVRNKVDSIVRQRLDELTPELVKDIIQQMIRQHLGWLVVWGGVFGGIIGLIAGVLQ
ncbi:DUF445 family protein [Rheinheimera aquimaris]|jgi:uncharacterized membrane-anchored protein YjiN (DUF445 family)|uniref:DUF445 family protein n=1 Tax=Rheinheimera aquimaris TaxID=412437 RepID=UPI000E7F42EA|nr:DUF445 family protein [Rheinheimera aquimaris]HBN87782.1 DUF445 domain-containing protein [Rheinheimera sp.]|tara:strand:- start:4175 stop:4882 length:708 start_codon:yes stop_codon:yes gene_type:complete